MTTEVFDVTDLYVEIGHFVLPRLAQFRDETVGFPLAFATREEWIDTLDKMIFSFIAVTHDNVHTDDELVRVQEGFNLFGLYLKELYI